MYVVEQPLLPPRPPRDCAALIPTRAIDLIIAFEVGSPEVYIKKYRRPIWPGAASGVTVGVGYDLGHTPYSVIAIDWERHPHRPRLLTAAGVTGPLARDTARGMADVLIEWDDAREVFELASVCKHYRIARRVFGPGFAELRPNAHGALTSLVFNRGGSMSGERRIEMRTIRDVCLPARDYACAAAELRRMVRVWRGTAIEGGMRRRREAEAALMETP